MKKRGFGNNSVLEAEGIILRRTMVMVLLAACPLGPVHLKRRTGFYGTFT
jgi:hypothetical protein